MRFGYVATNILDLWAEPRFNSERSSQLLFCEMLSIHDEQQGYWQVKQQDGYSGWVDKRQIVEVGKQSFDDYLAAPKLAVRAIQARLFDSSSKTLHPHFLYYGTHVAKGSTTNAYVRVKLPDGQFRLLKASTLCSIGKLGRKPVTGLMLVREARRFLGVPYLWGGVSPAGFDCSGLVQTICKRFGIVVPRDTKDQINSGIQVAREDVAVGDLLYFKRHVGFAIGKDHIIHSSIGGSVVRINALRPGLPDYREDLDRDFNQARRIV